MMVSTCAYAYILLLGGIHFVCQKFGILNYFLYLCHTEKLTFTIGLGGNL